MPKKVDHKLRREDFMAAAYRMIKKKGINGATFRAVAKEAGYTTGALVHYVDSMDKLLVEASEFSAREVRADMEKAAALPDKLEALRHVLYLALPSDEDKRGNWNFFLGFWERSAQSAEVRRLTHLRYVEWLKRTARLIKNARDAGDLPKDLDIRKASRACVAMIDGIATQTLRSGSPLSPKDQRELVDAWIELWLKPLRKLGTKRSARRAKADGAAHTAHS
jgi:AcrR family transcriptional regulator